MQDWIQCSLKNVQCVGVIESINHIYWNSEEAKSIWCIIANWRALSSSQRSKLGNSLKESFTIFKGKISLQLGGLVL